MRYTRNLKFEETPNYDYMLNLFTSLAQKQKIDLHDEIYDWNVRAVCIKEHPNFFDFIDHSGIHPFNQQGRFDRSKAIRINYSAEEENRIMLEAKAYKFAETKELSKLIRKEEMKRLNQKKFEGKEKNLLK